MKKLILFLALTGCAPLMEKTESEAIDAFSKVVDDKLQARGLSIKDISAVYSNGVGSVTEQVALAQAKKFIENRADPNSSYYWLAAMILGLIAKELAALKSKATPAENKIADKLS